MAEAQCLSRVIRKNRCKKIRSQRTLFAKLDNLEFIMKAKGDLFLNRKAAPSDLWALKCSLWVKRTKQMGGGKTRNNKSQAAASITIKEIMVNRTKTVAEETERE